MVPDSYMDYIRDGQVIDCLEFGSAEASMMVRSNNCSDSLPGPDAVHAFIKEEKEQYGEMIARV